MKRFFRRFVGTALAVSAIAACTDPIGSGAVWTKPGSLAAVALTRYTVSVAADPAGSGTITGSARSVEGTIGQQFTWTAVPASGYYFKEWKLLSAKTTKTDNPYTHTVASGETIVAVFGKLSSTITLPTGDGAKLYRYDGSLQIRVAPTEWTNTGGWKFQFYDTNQNEPLLKDVDGDSSISMDMASAPPATTLAKVSEFTGDDSPLALTWSDESSRIAKASTARVYLSDGSTRENAHRLILVDAPDTTMITGDGTIDFYWFLYCDRAATAKGSIGNDAFDLNLQLGWNLVRERNPITNGTLGAGTIATVGAISATSRWMLIYEPYPQRSLSYLPGTADGGTTPGIRTYNVQNAVYVEGNPGNLTRSGGYAFKGWNTAPDGSGMSYMPGDIFPMPNADVFLYPEWYMARLWKDVAVSRTQQYIVAAADGTGGKEGGIYYSFDFGYTWNRIRSEPYNWTAVDVSDDGKVVAAAYDPITTIGKLWYTNNANTATPTWIDLIAADSFPWTDVAFFKEEPGLYRIAAVGGDHLATSKAPIDDTNWTHTTIPGFNCTSVAGTVSIGGELVFIGGFDSTLNSAGAIRVTFNASFDPDPLPTHASIPSAPSITFNQIATTANGSSIIATSGNASTIQTIYLYTNVSGQYGTTTSPPRIWTGAAIDNTGANLYAISEYDSTNPLGLGLYRSSDGGSIWNQLPGLQVQGNNWFLDGSGDCSRLISAQNNGYIRVSSDFGATWSIKK